MELTSLSNQLSLGEPPAPYSSCMASSEVDQKFLGHFAKSCEDQNAYLSRFLFRVLGLSVIISEKLLQARSQARGGRTLDPRLNPKDKKLIHHILWLAREGLVMIEDYILQMVANYVELRVLAYKLRASFHHMFVLFHNNPPVNSWVNRGRSNSATAEYSLYPEPLLSRTRSDSREGASIQQLPSGPVGGGYPRMPPGLPIPGQLKRNLSDGRATFFLPYQDYRPEATSAFVAADTLATSLLPGSHPIRLSVKVEYVAYLYDCLGEREQSRRAARLAIRQVYEAKEGMDDESFEDASEMVGILGGMMRRGLAPKASNGSAQGSLAPATRPAITAGPLSADTRTTDETSVSQLTNIPVTVQTATPPTIITPSRTPQRQPSVNDTGQSPHGRGYDKPSPRKTPTSTPPRQPAPLSTYSTTPPVAPPRESSRARGKRPADTGSPSPARTPDRGRRKRANTIGSS